MLSAWRQNFAKSCPAQQ